jgi:hypothetical protein
MYGFIGHKGSRGQSKISKAIGWDPNRTAVQRTFAVGRLRHTKHPPIDAPCQRGSNEVGPIACCPSPCDCDDAREIRDVGVRVARLGTGRLLVASAPGNGSDESLRTDPVADRERPTLQASSIIPNQRRLARWAVRNYDPHPARGALLGCDVLTRGTVERCSLLRDRQGHTANLLKSAASLSIPDTPLSARMQLDVDAEEDDAEVPAVTTPCSIDSDSIANSMRRSRAAVRSSNVGECTRVRAECVSADGAGGEDLAWINVRKDNSAPTFRAGSGG